MKPQSVDEYIDSFTGEQKARLLELRNILRATLPDTAETLKWGNPAIIDKDGMILLIFAGYKQHINLIVTPSTKRALVDELAAYKTGKGSVQLVYDKPLPVELIEKIALYRVHEYHEQGVKWM